MLGFFLGGGGVLICFLSLFQPLKLQVKNTSYELCLDFGKKPLRPSSASPFAGSGDVVDERLSAGSLSSGSSSLTLKETNIPAGTRRRRVGSSSDWLWLRSGGPGLRLGLGTSLCAPPVALLTLSVGSLTQPKVNFPPWLDLELLPRETLEMYLGWEPFSLRVSFYILISSASPVVPMNVNLCSASLFLPIYFLLEIIC